MQAIYYTLCPSLNAAQTHFHIKQLRGSIRSLRRLNHTVPVYVFNFGIPRVDIEQAIAEFHVNTIEEQPYESALRCYCGEKAEALKHYPVHHKWLALDYFVGSDYEQLLYVDSDTVFLSDPMQLFKNYTTHDWCAREEPYSSNSYLGYDPNYLDETVLKTLTEQRNLRYLQPMNLGVVIMNHRAWERVHGVLDHFFSSLWSLLVWVAHNRQLHEVLDPRLQKVIEAVSKYEVPSDIHNMLRHPSSNYWIAGQVALLLALGRLENFSCGLLKPSHIVQGVEFEKLGNDGPELCELVICHYYSKNYSAFGEWHQERSSFGVLRKPSEE